MDIIKGGFTFKARSEWDDNYKRSFALSIEVMKFLHNSFNDDAYIKISKCFNAKEIYNTFNVYYLDNNIFINKSIYVEQQKERNKIKLFSKKIFKRICKNVKYIQYQNPYF